MFAFRDMETVQRVVSLLPPVGVGVKYGLPQSRKSSLMTPWQLFKHSNMPQKWQQREISNFDYLMFLNTIAGRTYNDLNQYPVFPWILSNYSSENIDLNDAANFRDLSKPIGALSETRKKLFKERFNNWDDPEIPPFHYGTHYSNAAFVFNWLFRLEPFTTFYLQLNDGKIFENVNSNRLFHSIEETWEHCLTDTHDVKELIPELFYLTEMFLFNENNCEEEKNLGIREDGNKIGNVILPKWANGKAEEFVKYIGKRWKVIWVISCQLNQWIDLIFGYKQRGAEAIRALNTFYYLTYEGAFNLRSIENAALRESIQQQILNFGQTPAQLLNEPHPPRHSIMTMSPLIFKTCPNDLCMIMKFISNSPVVHITANTFQQVDNPTLITIAQNLVFALNRWNPNYNQPSKQHSSTVVPPFDAEKNENNKNNATSSSSTSSVNQQLDTSILPSELPITVDPLLAVGNPSQKLPKRHLGDSFDQRLQITSANFVCSVDSKYIIACGYTDYSFRIIETENAQVRQVIYGHGDVVTCLARSETTLFADSYIASGSADCTVVLWHFSQNTGTIAGEFNSVGELPVPRAILTGHEAVITAITVSAEHGLVISGAKDGTLLIHTTMGDFLRNIEFNDGNLSTINQILLNRDCQLAIFHGLQQKLISTFSVNGKFLGQIEIQQEGKILSSVLSRDGEYFIIGTENGKILIFRLFPLELIYSYAQTDSSIKSVAISTNQKFVFGGLDSGAIVVFNVDFNRFDTCRQQQQTIQRRK
uniref:Putative neurobeachin homolog n=1 Tax=Meloidogyne enterolobii TaxID=390850 RepID=A0A6V7U0X4_MELEN|nr:unnamed protein product [Meloidogyne enterolobii]